jgi:hypothetical protein
MHQILFRWIVSSVFPVILLGVPSCSAVLGSSSGTDGDHD